MAWRVAGILVEVGVNTVGLEAAVKRVGVVLGSLANLVDDMVDGRRIVFDEIDIQVDLVDVTLGLLVDGVMTDDEAVAVAVSFILGQNLSAQPVAHLRCGRVAVFHDRLVCAPSAVNRSRC